MKPRTEKHPQILIPMTDAEREAAYLAQNGGRGLTHRQVRRLNHKSGGAALRAVKTGA